MIGGLVSKVSPTEALERLRQGNARFASGAEALGWSASKARRAELVAGQEPFAVVVGCSDSRVPPEIVFDQGLGDLFVIRVAGNIVTASEVGSVEYAVEVLGTRLIVVLGHTRCGAVRATLEEIERPTDEQSPNLTSIVNSIRPSVEPFLASGLEYDLDDVLRQAMRANVWVSVNHLRSGSEMIEEHIARDGVLVVGAEYSLETGLVEFLSDPE
jgi:carbonic anhydrase